MLKSGNQAAACLLMLFLSLAVGSSSAQAHQSQTQSPLRQLEPLTLQQGSIHSIAALDNFIFDPEEGDALQLYHWLRIIAASLVIALLAALMLALFNRRLQREVEERKVAEAQLKTLADTDPLTGLLNRRAFTKRYSDELARSRRYRDGFSIILIDLDKFKHINDRYGHDAGDRVIAAVADLLRAGTRESDRCGRFGGEEFIMLLPNTMAAEAAGYAHRLCRDIRALEVELRSGELLNISASIGVAQWAPEDKESATIIKADKALYKAKTAGRDQVVVWSETI